MYSPGPPQLLHVQHASAKSFLTYGLLQLEHAQDLQRLAFTTTP